MSDGNTTALLQVQGGHTRNEVGKRVPIWHDVMELEGFIDLQSGSTPYTTYNAPIQESTHVFVGDYVPIPDTLEVDGQIVQVCAENARMVAKSQEYDVMLIDDPMELHDHLEIYLKFTGGQ